MLLRHPGSTAADSDYWNEEQIDNVVGDDMQVLIPPDAGKRGTPRPGWDGRRYTFMRTVLPSDYGGGPIQKTQGDGRASLRTNKAQPAHRPLQRRGRSAARSEWRLITATHNLMKLHKHQ